MNSKKPVILFFCEHTSQVSTRSGIQRVVIEAAWALSHRAELQFVKWDAVDGQLRYFDTSDLDGLFGKAMRSHFHTHKACHKVGYRFSDTIENPNNTWLVFPELFYFLPGGNAIVASIIAQCREYGVRTAAIFYDLIPVREYEYAVGKADHLAYVIELLRCDKIFAISRFSADDLLEFIRGTAKFESMQLNILRERIVPVPLGENREDELWGSMPSPNKVQAPIMVLVGTVEPRKQQTRLLKALNDARNRFPELNDLQVEVFGSLHAASSDALHEEIARNPRITYRQYVPDEVIEDAYARAWFTAFVSNHEGYGLPIVESLRRGVPCITSSFGAMAEVAEGGGCLLVNANDDLALQDALARMLLDHTLRMNLRREIANRPRRSWGDYANDLIVSMFTPIALEQEQEARFRQEVLAASERENRTGLSSELHGVTWTVAFDAAELRLNASVPNRSSGRTALMFVGSRQPLDNLSRYSAFAVLKADIVVCSDALTPQTLVNLASHHEFDELLPADIVTGDLALEAGLDAAVRISRQRQTAHQMASDHRMQSSLMSQLRCQLETLVRERELAIVISTFNRADFVERNAEWVLAQIDEDNLPVHCVVVDNASTDDSYVRLQRFVGHPKFTLIQNANNTGMLGNLRVCAAGLHASYIWLTGDDDFIVPGAIQRTLSVIREHPGLPLLIHNFGVYHREKFGLSDTPEQFLKEIIRLAPTPRPDGVRRINEIADEHDNLFTAIYPIVFRSDVLSACFNYPFDGVPFSNLTESVPTTKIILGAYRYCDAYWFAEPGIVGNAHNSWSRHRPRWHLVLMPLVFQLARDAGVDPRKVWLWTKVHKRLFDEAMGISINLDVPAHIALPNDIEQALNDFREPVDVDPRLRTFSAPPVPLWQPPHREHGTS